MLNKMFPLANQSQSQITRKGERHKNKHKKKKIQHEVRNKIIKMSSSESAPLKDSVSNLTFKEFKPGTALFYLQC